MFPNRLIRVLKDRGYEFAGVVGDVDERDALFVGGNVPGEV